MPTAISLRLPDDDLQVIDSAARRRGRTRTDFMREAAVRAAEQVILEETIIRMSPEGFAHFMTEIEGPGRVVPEMVEMIRKAKSFEQD